MAGKIFVNYRRDDSRADARSIADRLGRALGAASVFMDVNALEAGQRFDLELEKALSQCDVFVTVIGPQWLDILKARASNHEPDYVRMEVAKALTRGILVIPVLVGGARLPASADLPEDLRLLSLHQKQDLTHERFDRDMADLIAVITARQGRRRWGRWALAGLATAATFAILLFNVPIPGFRLTDALVQRLNDTTLAAGQTFGDCNDCPRMVVVPPGEFVMGSPDTEPGHTASEVPQHTVRIPRRFAVGKFEVTVKEYETFVAATGGVADGGGCAVWTAYGHRFEQDRTFRNPSFSQNPQHPVVCVSWQAALTYANWLTTRTGRSYRLLSEAEWEYAARANSTSRYYFGNEEAKLCEHGNGADRTSAFLWGNHLCSDGVGVQTAEVGHYKPNAFGLYDMLGNASEWVMDCLQPSYSGAPADGTAWMAGDCKQRVVRGGSWDNGPKDLRSASRGGYALQGKDNIGFRVARELE